MSGLLDETALPEPPATGPGLFGEATTPAAAPYRVLARKYRPTRFEDMIGQQAMVRILRNAFALGRIAHAYMLTGVRGVGKTTTARIIARALNCIGPDGTGGPTPDPCGVCANCRAILEDRHPDVVEMDAASRTGVDDVREIIEATRFRPLQARTKVFVVDEVHMLSRNAFNALLKTLEEPPPHVKFIFATTEIRKVPVTVLSRCQRFDLRRVSVAELTAHFGRIARQENVAIDDAALDLVARAADGSVRDGLSLLDQAIAQSNGGTVDGATVADMLGTADRGAVFDLMEALLAGNAAEALAITDRAHERGADLGLLLGDLLDLTHTLTRLKTIPGLRTGAELPEAERSRGGALAERLTMPVLGRLWQMLLKGVGEVETAPDRRQAAEMVLIRLCHVADLPPPGELVKRLTTNPPAAPSTAPPPASTNWSPGPRAAVNAPLPAADPHSAPRPRTAPHQLPRGRRPRRRPPRSHAARPSRPLRPPRPLRPGGDRAPPRARGAARPRSAPGRPPPGSHRRPLDHRLLSRRGRAHPRRAVRRRRCRPSRHRRRAPARPCHPRRLPGRHHRQPARSSRRRLRPGRRPRDQSRHAGLRATRRGPGG